MATAPRSDSTCASSPEQWVDQHGEALFRYAVLHVRDPEAAEEVVQECLVAALGARKRFSGQSSERTWLIGILKHKLIDHARQEARNRALQEEAAAASEAVAETDFFDRKGKWKAKYSPWGGDPGKHLEKREFWEVFQRCLGGLPAALAEAFMLREIDRLASQEVCEVLELSATNLWTRLHRARLGLQECLERHWFGGRERKARKG